MKTIAIAGKNNIAVDVLLYCIENIDGRIVCICNKDDIGINSWQKSLRWFANKNRIPVLDLQEIYEEKDLVFISLEYDRIINPELFLDARLYNVHFSLLPQYKGAYTSIWPLLNGEKKTGVSLHKIEKGIDTGDIIKQKIIEIEEKDCALDIYNKYIKYGTELACEFIDALNAKNDIKAVPQTWIGSTFFSRKSIDFKAI